MRAIKLAVISFAFLFIIVTLITLLLPSANTISRAIDIRAPYTRVYQAVYQLDQWSCWYPEGNMIIPEKAKTATKGSAITINNALVAFEIATPNNITAVWQWGNKETITGSFYFIPSGDSSITTLQWQFVQKVKWYPWEKLSLIAGNRTIGPFLEQGLEQLKNCTTSQ